MIDIRPALRSLILSDPATAAMAGTRCFPSILPQGVVEPSIVQNLVGETTDMHMQGPSLLSTARIQLNCWAQTADQAVELANLVMDHINGYSGTQDEVRIQGIFPVAGRDEYDPVAKLHGRQRDYFVWYITADFLLTEDSLVIETEDNAPIEEE